MKRFYSLVVMLLCILSANAQYGEYVGGDISDLPLYEKHNKPYLDNSGNTITDLITWFKDECKWNAFRVRLFVNPTGKGNDGTTVDPSVCQDLDYVKALGKRIKDAGCTFMLDIHYSDTWVDATHIQAPSVCSSMTVDKKAEWIYSYTKETLQTLKDAGALPDFVQVGNEIMYGFMDIKVHPYEDSSDNWTGYLKVLGQGCKAVRDFDSNIKIVIHTDRPANTSYCTYYYEKLDNASVPYDVIGLSYYPFWHGDLNSFSSTMLTLEKKYSSQGKKIQIVETAYNFQNTPSGSYDTSKSWAYTPTGQYAFMKDLIDRLGLRSSVNGLYYFCPEEAGNGDDSEKSVLPGWMNRGLWWPNEGSTGGGHWPVDAKQSDGYGMVHYLLKTFLKSSSAINEVPSSLNPQPSTLNRTYNLSGQQVDSNFKGIVIKNGKKVLQ